MFRSALRALYVVISCVAVLWAFAAWAADPAASQAESDDLFKPAAKADNPFDAKPATSNEPAAKPASADAPSPAEAKIRKALAEATRLQVIEMPLREVSQMLSDIHGIGIQLDEVALVDASIDPEGIVTLAVDNISLGSALRLLLRPLNMTYTIRDEVLLITTEDAAAQMTELRAYNVGETLDLPSGGVRELAATLKSIFEQEQGPFDAVPFHNFLIVKTSQHKHEELVRLLDQMKDKLAFDPPKQ